MKFEFCWEHRNCDKPCPVSESKTIFCWRIARTERLHHPDVCAKCTYRKNWFNGEYSLQEFIARHDRRRDQPQRKRILLVDDEPNFLYALEDTMHDNNYNCLTAIDGEEGLFFAREAVPDLIVTDVIMPKIDGYELCRKIKGDERTRHIPVIMVSARGMADDIARGRRAGSDAYLVKPLSPQALLERISSLLSGS